MHDEYIPNIKADKTLVGDGVSVRFPSTVSDGDVFIYGEYEYRYNYEKSPAGLGWIESDTRAKDGWGVMYVGSSTIAGAPLTTIAGKDVTSMKNTFKDNTTIKELMYFPSTLKTVESTFYGSTSLTTAPAIPENVFAFHATFKNCTSLTGIVEINTIGNYGAGWFENVDFQAQKLTLTGSVSDALLDKYGASGINYCAECNGYCEGH